MKTARLLMSSLGVTVIVFALFVALPGTAGGKSPSGGADTAKSASEASQKDGVVTNYISGCRKKPAKDANCDKPRKEAIEVLKEDLRTLGSSANRKYFLTILRIFKSDEPELRIAAADALGMIGLRDSDAALFSLLVNDPVPDVRKAVREAIVRGKGPELFLLGSRTMAVDSGAAPDPLPDPGKLPLPVLPQSTYLYFASDPAAGRISYLAKDLNETTAFYKGKVKKGPLTFYEFQEKYRYQLGDEERAESHAADAASAKQNENLKPDPANMQAMMEKMQKMGAVQGKRAIIALNDMYNPPMFEKPTVYVLEERQIGSRTYPTRYVVLYQDVALKRPGYRLSWMTISDDAIKTAQADTLKDEKQEEAGKKRQEALEDLVKKKDEQEKKKFKKGQSDLEKELGF